MVKRTKVTTSKPTTAKDNILKYSKVKSKNVRLEKTVKEEKTEMQSLIKTYEKTAFSAFTRLKLTVTRVFNKLTNKPTKKTTRKKK